MSDYSYFRGRPGGGAILVLAFDDDSHGGGGAGVAVDDPHLVIDQLHGPQVRKMPIENGK